MKILNSVKEYKIAKAELITVPTSANGLIYLVGSVPVALYNNMQNIAVPVLLANMFSEGTKFMTRDEFQDELDYLGAELSFSSSAMNTSFQLSVSTEKFGKALDLLADALMSPALKKKDFEKIKKRTLDKTLQMQDSTTAMAESAFSRLLYPSNSPMRVPDIKKQLELIENTKLSELKKVHKEQFSLEMAKIVLAGDLRKSDVYDLKAKLLSESMMQSKNLETEFTTHFKSKKGKSLSVKTIKDKSTSSVFLGCPLDLKKSDDDYWPMLLAFDILGRSGFVSRLGSIVREKYGLTYHTYARMNGFIKDNPGYWFAFGTFSPDLTEKGISVMKKVISDFVKDGPSKREFEDSKTGLLGSRLTRVTSTEQIANLLHTVIASGETVSEFAKLEDKIMAVKYSDVKRVIKKYINLEDLKISLAGSVSENKLCIN